MTDPSSITILTPLWNEGDVIPGALERIHGFLEAHFTDFEMILIESGSTDGSDRACDRFSESHERCVTIHESGRNGYGSALKLGIARATKALVSPVTVDVPFPLETLTEATRRMTDHDCVLSYRSPDDRRLYRRFQSLVYNQLAKKLVGLHVKHVNSAFRMYRREVIQSLPLVSDGWLIELEVPFRIEQQGLRFLEIPVPLVPRTEGTTSVTVGSGAALFWELVRFAGHERVVRRMRGVGGGIPRR